MARVLVVDDEGMIALLLRDFLAHVGHHTVGPASSEAAALDFVSSSRIDAAILDISLGDHDSFNVARALRARGIPFVFATGHDIVKLPADLRLNRTVPKPFDLATVRKVVSDLVDDRRLF